MTSDLANILKQAGDLAEAGVPFVLATVTQTQGSTPRDLGATMIWRPGEELIGTVGGGQFEHLVIEAARRHYEARSCGTEYLVLGSQADQCCGGTVGVFLEYCGPGHRVVIFGAGHVSAALVRELRPGGFEIVVVDDRPDWNSPDRFARCRRIGNFDQGVGVARERPDSTLVCVMTCSHEKDYRILSDLLRAPPLPAFVGLIGSQSKRARFFRRLKDDGIDPGIVESVQCPIGVGDLGKSPQLVAISAAAQILMEARRLGTP